MSDVSINIGSDAPSCVPCLGSLQVRAVYQDNATPDGLYKPLSLEAAESVVTTLAARGEILTVTIEPLGA